MSRITLKHPQIWLIAALILFALLSVLLGRFPAPYWMPAHLLRDDPFAQQLVLNLRLPRILAAILLGMALAGSGAVMQMIFRNPLVEPGVLGVSQGAALGAGIAIVFFGGFELLQRVLQTVVHLNVLAPDLAHELAVFVKHILGHRHSKLIVIASLWNRADINGSLVIASVRKNRGANYPKIGPRRKCFAKQIPPD